jgi:hypothetical protein
MKKYICVLALAALLPACEQKETTVTNPPGDTKTESNTTVIKESPAPESKTETNTTINAPSSETKTETTTTTSPSP